VTTRKTGPARGQGTRRPRRRARGYPSDLTDAQWQVIAPYLPGYVPGRRGRPPVWPVRRIVEAILYLDRTGCAWRYLPADFPPWRTVYGYGGVDSRLQPLSARLVADEVTAKLAAVDVALQHDNGSREKEQILEVTGKLEPDNENSLLAAALTLRAAMPPARQACNSSARLGADVAAYLYFAATIIRFFADPLGEQQMKEAESSGVLDKLARCPCCLPL
jgi:transposase